MAQHGMEVDDTSSRKPLVSVEGGDKAPSAPTALAAAGGAGSDQQDTWGPRSSNTGPDAVPSAETGGSKGTKAPARDRSPHEKELLTPEELEAAGFCPVKREFLVTGDALKAIHDHIRESQEQARAAGKKTLGQNKKRGHGVGMGVRSKEDQLCRAVAQGTKCRFGDSCRWSHDVAAYLARKPADIGDTCPLFDATGYCPAGFNCRFGGAHIDEGTPAVDGKPAVPPTLTFRPEAERTPLPAELNEISMQLKKDLRKRKYVFQRAAPERGQGRKGNGKGKERARGGGGGDDGGAGGAGGAASAAAGDGATATAATAAEPPAAAGAKRDASAVAEVGTTATTGEEASAAKRARVETADGAVAAAMPPAEVQPPAGAPPGADVLCPPGDDVRPRLAERRPLDLAGKVYIAPLTTVGNLPFRRVCSDLGADITVGEMALATSILGGNPSEASLLRRHPCERTFGVQLAGNNGSILARCAEFVDRECEVDFIDLNCGCPLDPLCKKGIGAGLMLRDNKLVDIARQMAMATRCPVTVKMRAAYADNKPIANKIIRKLRLSGSVSAVGIHGRSRQQRYTRLADWDYISTCAESASAPLTHPETGDDVPPLPVIGNGDVLSYTEWYDHLEHTGVTTNMLARGILVKPWLPTEIKERRHWDISAGERLDILRDFVKYGLEHWGSDDVGVGHTRRFLLEWLSFTCRYVPVGVLERVQTINGRPPFFVGRNDLETLMSSANSEDWVRISEMLLGPRPPGFHFVPKHKASAYSALAASAASGALRK